MAASAASGGQGASSAHHNTSIMASSMTGVGRSTRTDYTNRFFEFLCSLKNGMHSGWKLPYFIFFMEYFQWVALLLVPDIPWGIPGDLVSVVDVLRLDPAVYLDKVTFAVLFGFFTLTFFATLVSMYYLTIRKVKKELPLKLLRIAVVAQSSVLYLPVLNVLLTPIDCTLGTEEQPSINNMYTEETCWKGPWLVANAVSLLVAPLFLLFGPAVTYLFFDIRMKHGQPTALPSGRNPARLALCKGLCALSFKVIHRDIRVRLFIYVAMAVLLTAYYVRQLPYYSTFVNAMAAGILTSSVLGSTVAFVQTYLDPADTVFYTFCVSLAAGYLLGIAMVVARVKILSVKTAAFLEMTGSDLEEVLQKAPQGLLEETPDVELEDKYNLAAIFPEPELVEVCSRFVGKCGKAERVARKKRVLVAGLVRYPNEACLSNVFANFALAYLHDGLVASVHVKHGKGNFPAPDDHFVNIHLEKLAAQMVQERSLGNGDMDAVSFVEFQKSFKLAKHYHLEALLSIQAFWLELCAEDIDINTIPALTNKISQNETKAATLYTQLVAKYPSSKPLFMSYGKFQEHVRRDSDKAIACYEMVEGLEEDGNLAERSQGRPALSEASGGAGSQPDSSHVMSSERQRAMKSDNLAATRRYREILKNRKSTAVWRLSAASIVSTVIPVIFALVCIYSFSVSATTATKMAHLGLLASSRIKSVESAVLFTRLLEDFAYYGDVHRFHETQGKLAHEMDQFRANQQELFHATYKQGFDDLDYYWELLFPVKIIISGTNMATVDMNLWDACNVYINAGIEISRYPIERMREQDDFRVRIIYDNAAGELKQTLMDAQHLFGENIKNMYAEIMLIQSMLVSLVIVILLGMGIGVFRPALRQITADRFSTLNIFLEIPKNVVRRIYKNVVVTLDEDQTEQDARHNRRDAVGASYTNTDRGWEDSLIKKTAVKYIAGVGLICVLFLVALIVALVQLNQVIHAGDELDAAGQRNQLARELHRLSRELVQAADAGRNVTTANGIPATPADIISRIRTRSNELSDVHFFIKFGNLDSYWGTEKRYPPLEDLMYQRECLRETACSQEELESQVRGLDAHFSAYVENMLELTHTTVSTMEVNMTLVEYLSDLEENVVSVGLNEASALLMEEKRGFESYLLNTWAAILGVTIFLALFFYLFVFMGLVSKLRDVTDKTGNMLLMIPPEVIEKVPAIKAFLESGLAMDAEAKIQQELADARLTNNAIVNHKDAEPLVVITENGEIMSYNHAAYKLFGYTEAEVLGKNVRMLMPGKYAQKHDQYLQAYMDTGEKKMLKGMREMMARKKNGKHTPVELTVDEVILVGGETMVDGRKRERRVFVGIMKDIASLKSALERLTEQEKFSESIMNTSTGALVVINDQGTVVKINRAAESLFMYPAEDVLGNNVTMLMLEEDAAKHDGYLARANQEKGFREIGFRNQFAARKSTGKRVIIGISVSMVVVGSDTFYAAFITDDTELKAREAEIIREKIFSEAVLNTSTAGIIVMDELGIVATFNNAASHIFQYSEDEVIGQNVKMLMPHRYASRHDEYISTYLRTGVRHVIGIGRVMEGLKKDGTEVVLRVAVAEVEVSGNRWFTGFLHDETERVEIERQMTEDRKFSQSVVDVSISGIIVISRFGIVKKFNNAAMNILGYTAEEVIGNNVKMLMPEREAVNHDRYLAAYHETGVRKMIGIGRTVKAKRKDGSEVHVKLDVGECEVKGEMWYTGFLLDISEQVAMDTAITKQKKYADAIVENSYSAIVVIDEAGIIASFNRSAERIFMHSASDAIGKNVKMIMPPRIAREHDKYLADFKKTGVAKIIGTPRMMQGMRADGSEVTVLLNVNKTTVEGVVWYTGLLEDHTERVVRERKMAREQKFNNAVIDTSSSGIVVMSDVGKVKKWNNKAAEIFGYSAEEVIGKNVKMIMPEETAQEHDAYLDNYIRTGVKKMIGIGRDVVGLRKDGRRVEVALQVGETFIETETMGTQRWFTGFVTDISKEAAVRRETEEAARFAKAVVDVSSSAIILTDSRGTIEQFNAAAERIFKHTAQGAVGRNVKILMQAEDAAVHDDHLRRYMETGQAHILRKRRKVKALAADMSELTIQLCVVEITIDGQTWFSGFATDLTEQAREEEETRRTVQLGAAITQASASSIVVIDDVGKILRFSGSASKLFAYKEDEVVGKNVKILMPQRYARQHDGYLAAYKRTGKGKVVNGVMETQALRKDGVEFPIRLSVGLCEMGGQNVFTGVIDDISGIADTLKGNDRATRMFNSMLDAAPAGMVVATQEGAIVRVNAALLKMAQYTEEELTGKNVSVLLPQRFADDHDEQMRRYVQTRMPRVMNSTRTLPLKRKDGTEVDVAFTLREAEVNDDLFFYAHLVDKSNDVDYNNLIELEKDVLDRVPSATVAITDAGDVTAFNAAAEELFGRTADSILGRNVKMLMPAQIASKHDAYLARHKTTGKKKMIGKTVAQKALRGDGTTIAIKISVKAVSTNGNAGYVAVIEAA